ncbi:MAG TPA: CHAT domain-containing protein [Cyclobacteriaceae bacterium]|nr:CHAT domain-containing protein [Cyclobacteriaceae bacterium]
MFRFLLIITLFTFSFQGQAQQWMEAYQQSLNFYNEGQYADAFSSAENALTQYLNADGSMNQNYLSLLRQTATSAYAAAMPEKGIDYAQREIRLRNEMNLPQDRSFASALYNLGSLYFAAEQFVEAIKSLTEALTIIEQYYNKGEEEWLDCKWKLATAYYFSAQTAQANLHFDESFRYITSSTDITTDYLSALYYSAQLKTDLDLNTEANRQLTILEEIYRENEMDDDTAYADILSLLAYNYQAQNKFEEAERYYVVALPALEKQQGKNSKAYINALNRRAANLESLGRGAEAQQLISQISTDDADAITLNNLAAISQSRGEFEKAEQYYQKALAQFNLESKTESQQWAETAENLSQLYIELNRFAEAEELLKKSSNIIEITYSNQHERFASSLQKKAVLYRNQSRFDESEALYQKAADIYRAKNKEQSEAYASLVSSAAILFQIRGEYKKAEDLFMEAMTLFHQIGLTKSKEYAALLNNYAVLEQLQGDFYSSKNLLTEVVEITTSQYGEESAFTANALENLAQVYISIGNFDDATGLLNKSLAVREKIYGKQHPVYAGNLLSIGRLKQSQGAFNEAEPFFINARNTLQQSQGRNSAAYASATNALALFYQYMGNYAAAEPLFAEARITFRQLYGERSRDYATTIANLSLLYELTGREDEAIALLQESIKIDEQLLGPRHPGYAVGLHNLASLNQKAGKYTEAKDLFERALKIYELSLGINTPSYANTLNNLGVLYQDLKQFNEAEQALKQALDIRRKMFGAQHPDYAYSLYSLASFYQFTDRRTEAAPLFEEVITEYLRQVTEFFPSMSEKEKSAFYAKIKPVLENYQDFVLEYYLESPSQRAAVIGSLYNLQLSTKALLLNASNKVRDRIMSGNDEQLKTDYRNWVNLKEDIIRYYNYSVEELQQQAINIKSLEEQANSIEKQLSAKSTLFADEFEKKEQRWQDVRDVLSQDEVAVEIIRVRKKYMSDSVIYAALVVHKNSASAPDLIIFPMGEQLENRKYNYYRNTIRFNLPDTVSYSRFFKPLHPYLTGANRVYLSVDGVFNKVNFNTLHNTKTGKFLIDEFTITLLSNTNELLSSRSEKKNRTARIFGDPAFSDLSALAQQQDGGRLTRSKLIDAFAEIYDLPGTKEETERLSELLKSKSWNTQLYVRNDATVKNLKQVNNPQLLHIATHGFFLPDKEFENDPNFGIHQQNEQSNPLFRSGLLFAGSSSAMATQNSDNEDGILTAYEAMNLNLDETELIVLSACETGLGEVRNGEGVYGLQRAFIVAGAKGIVMSLWKVDDETTQQLMNNFYEKWISGMDKLVAFRQAQKELKELHPEPYYWGAFVMLGK